MIHQCTKLVDMRDEEVVSSLILYTVALPSRNLAVIEEVFTREDCRNEGRATKLIKEAIDLAKSLGASCIELTVREDKPEYQRFYEKFGFKSRENLSFRLNVNYNAHK